MANYLANTNTKEIHKLLPIQPRDCKINEIKLEHKRFLNSEYQIDALIKNEKYNGCKFCYPEKHTPG